jgi:hypothetical protein
LLLSRRDFLAGITVLFGDLAASLPSPAIAGRLTADQVALFVGGLIQPFSLALFADGLARFQVPAATANKLLDDLASRGLIIEAASDPVRYSLTSRGQHSLDPEMRRLRDQGRLLLLNAAHRLRLGTPREALQPEAGVSPVWKINLPGKGGLGKRDCLSVSRDSAWLDVVSRGTDLTLLSFAGPDQLSRARWPDDSNRFDLSGVALCLGVSPSLLRWMTVYRRANYRAFRLEKRSGGYRRIMAPRAFLKTTQRFLAQRLFSVLPVHDAVHSFRTGRSFITNALVHEGSPRLLKIDIQDFFDFISERMVVDLLARNGFSISESRQLAALTTIGGSIPQGAPTSPVLSNSLLYDFDSAVSSEASARGLRYSRYSDDISLSGASESALEQMAIKIGAELKGRFGMRVNSRKAHLLLPHQRKIVTGVVVNERVTPSKAWRRQVRAAFDRAEREPAAGFARLDELQGYVSYLKAFPMHRTSAAVLRYERICRLLRRMRDVALV